MMHDTKPRKSASSIVKIEAYSIDEIVQEMLIQLVHALMGQQWSMSLGQDVLMSKGELRSLATWYYFREGEPEIEGGLLMWRSTKDNKNALENESANVTEGRNFVRSRVSALAADEKPAKSLVMASQWMRKARTKDEDFEHSSWRRRPFKRPVENQSGECDKGIPVEGSVSGESNHSGVYHQRTGAQYSGQVLGARECGRRARQWWCFKASSFQAPPCSVMSAWAMARFLSSLVMQLVTNTVFAVFQVFGDIES
ncbi:hypothetical protein EDB19DRAFT_1835862 [Suillus lakei]|nr:hypothetical protein EDB19DRAFT_1835862 [Suillus lakei]